MLLLNETSATRDVADIRNLVGFVGLITIALLIIIVTQRSRSLSRPLSTAGDALTQISQGNFDLGLPPASDDEIGGLISNIQLTANRLKCYVQGELAYAVTEKQLETAKSIQRDFLLPYLPVSPNYDVKAFSRPALQIGADWYDMVDTGDHAIFIVADVCDKESLRLFICLFSVALFAPRFSMVSLLSNQPLMLQA